MKGSITVEAAGGNHGNILPWSAVFSPSTLSGFTGTWRCSSGMSGSCRSAAAPSAQETQSGSLLRGPFYADIPGLAYTFINVVNNNTTEKTITVNFYDSSGSTLADCSSTVQPGAMWSIQTSSSPSADGVSGINGKIGNFTIEGTDLSNVVTWAAVVFSGPAAGFAGFPISIE
ncbi:MAG: hypothetical protein HYY96_00275 [Candidatus Tectomicrobia bacterium]|nr:hypothetical protein [Candidatus Tectomicrobia bacterium]